MACTLETLGNRTLMQFNATRDTASPIKAIRVTKIANLDVIFIFTVVNHGLDALHDELLSAISAHTPLATITISDTPFMLSSNVMVMSIRAPINNGLDLFYSIVKVLQNRCEYFADIAPSLEALIDKSPQETEEPESELQKLQEYLQQRILHLLCAQRTVVDIDTAIDYVQLWNTRQNHNLPQGYVQFTQQMQDKFSEFIKDYCIARCDNQEYLLPKMQEQIRRQIHALEDKSQTTLTNTITLGNIELREIWARTRSASLERVRLSII